jgi:hypothetical protein
MGWTSYHATHYKNGKVDRKAECDAYFMEGLNRGYYDVLKSSMVGKVYYAAVKPLKKYNKDNDGNQIIVDIPINEQEVIGVVFLTSTDSKDYYNFSYKEMDETVGPCYYDCPKGILDLLTPTNSEWANNWRTKCREQLEKKKNPNSLNKLPEGTVIQVTMPFDTRMYREGDIVKLTKAKWGKRYKWFASSCYFTQGLMKSLEGHYEIIKRRE